MKAVLFTKLFAGRTPEEVGTAAAELGFDGIDLLIRPGCTVSPGEPAALRAARDRLAALGLAVPMATTDLTDPDHPSTERILGACADAGIRLLRLGYWKYDVSRPYRELLADAQRQLDGLGKLAERFELRLVIQLHGGTIHSSGALAHRLLDGRDPARFAAYPDPGNQAVQDGRENWRLTFELLDPWLACVGVKNGGWCPHEVNPDGQQVWRSRWTGIPEGMVRWDDIIGHLSGAGFDGLLSFHSHYELPYKQVLDQTRLDLRYVRRLIGRHW